MATVIPIRPGVVIADAPPPPGPPLLRWAICPLCTVRTTVNEFSMECACGTVMHGECYHGRLLPLAEWQAYCRVMNDAVDGVYDDEGSSPPWPAVRCETCRAKGGA